MDEPTLGLDAPIARELREHVKNLAYKEGKSILLTSHYLQEVEELCEYIYVLDKGLVIAEGTPKELSHLGSDHKVLCIELNLPHEELSNELKKLCFLAEDTKLEHDISNDSYTLTSKEDLSSEVAKILLKHNMPIKNFYTKEPNLEDAIIKLSKGA